MTDTKMRRLRLFPASWRALAAWVMLPLFAMAQWRLFPSVGGDMSYYWRKIMGLRYDGMEQTMTEYPVPVVWGMDALRAASGQYSTFFALYVGVMLLAHAALAWLLWQARERHGLGALWFWLCFVPLIGALSVMRFDILTAVLAGGALLTVRRRPALAGAMIGLGAAIKLWPALLLLPLLAVRPDRERTSIDDAARPRLALVSGFAVIGGGLGLASLASAGLTRSASPLTWQADRGLQIESLCATPVMLLGGLGDRRYTSLFSAHNAFEINGPGTDLLLQISSIATIVGLAAMALLIGRLLLAREPRADAPALVVFAVIALMIATNKTLSPQYLLWLAGPWAAALSLCGHPGGTRRRAVAMSWALLAAALLTTLVYPVLYSYLIDDNFGTAASVLPTLILVARNVLLLAITCCACRWAWQACAGGHTEGHVRH